MMAAKVGAVARRMLSKKRRVMFRPRRVRRADIFIVVQASRLRLGCRRDACTTISKWSARRTLQPIDHCGTSKAPQRIRVVTGKEYDVMRQASVQERVEPITHVAIGILDPCRV